MTDTVRLILVRDEAQARSFVSELADLLSHSRELSALKRVRAETGWSLVQAKRWLARFRDNAPWMELFQVDEAPQPQEQGGSMHRHTPTVLRHIREAGLAASLDDDGDIVVTGDDVTVVVSVNDIIVNARMMYMTAAPVNALAMVSRKLNQRLLIGRLVFPDDGGMFMICVPHRYNEIPNAFDSVSPVVALMEVAQSVVAIANEFGYQL